MISLSDKWNILKNGDALSQKFMGRVKPEAPLKNRIDTAQKKLQLQISRLGEIDTKLKSKHDVIFEKIVNAKKSNNENYAKVYANELVELRKMKNMVGSAKLSMEQVQLRLNTVSELGDVVVTLSPCMSLIKGLSTSLGDMMPSAAASMQDLSNMLGDIVTGSSLTHDDSIGIIETSNSDAMSILEEAQSIVEGNIRNNMPEPPVTNTTIDSILAEKEKTI
jgi:division protein CdvB (Snf7/Vps24/ESCRT-III family)|tara:strand:- start:5717 stop:6379 length:663 start_codon:yes stop_codon:yes gene_type:complete